MDSNWLLIVTIAILAVAMLFGYMRGLIRTVLNLIIGVLTFILVLIFSPPGLRLSAGKHRAAGLCGDQGGSRGMADHRGADREEIPKRFWTSRDRAL